MKKNFILILSFLAFVFLAFVAFFHPNKKIRIDEAFQQFCAKDYLATELTLTIIEKSEPSSPLYNYRAFLSLAKKDFATCDAYFHKALHHTYDEYEKGKLYLGKALSLYYQKKFEEIGPLLDKAKKVENSKDLFLIEALHNYETNQFEKASLAFKTYFEKEEFENHWFEHVVLNDFSSNLLEVYLGHALIEEKKYSAARAMLEKNIESVPSAILFLGYNYLKESESLPFSEQKSFLNVAHCYLDRSFDSCAEERKKLAPCLTMEIKRLLKTDEECFFAFFFIHLLEKWQCESALDEIALQLMEKMAVDGHLKTIAFCNTLKEEFKEGMFHDLVLKRLFFILQSDLKEKKHKNPFENWQKIETFAKAAFPLELIRETVRITQNEILSLLQEEKVTYTKSIRYLKFWKEIANEELENKEFAKALLKHGMLFWRTENEEQKGSQILKVALHIADETLRHEFSKEIEEFFRALYKQALAVNMVSRLSLIYDACQEFNIGFKGMFSKEELANHLADAAHFFKIRNYLAAKTHAEWVSKVEPRNALALKLVGLSSLFLGNYAIAHSYLEQILEPDEETAKALLLCETYLEEEEKKTALAQVGLFTLE